MLTSGGAILTLATADFQGSIGPSKFAEAWQATFLNEEIRPQLNPLATE
jgi:hypothetical protein